MKFNDLKIEINLVKNGLAHQIFKRKINKNINKILSFNAPEIIKNSIAINELKPRNNDKGALILLGAFTFEGKDYVVRTVINVNELEIQKIDIYNLYSIQQGEVIKKESKLASQDSTPVAYYDSTISVKDLLEISKSIPQINSVLSKDVLKNLGVERIVDNNITENLKFSKFSNEVDFEGNNLSEQQARFFKDSKVVDENGDLLVVYHETTWEFYTFEKEKASPEEDMVRSI